LEIARERRGAQFDPDIVDEFCRHARDLLSITDEETDWMALIDAEPGLRTRLSEPEIDNALEAVADFTDLRSPYFAGHSRGVAELAAAAAREIGLSEVDITLTRRARTQPPPYRPAMQTDQAANELRGEVTAGRLDGDTVDAVLAAAGHKRRKRHSGPAGLTAREIEVLTLIARGASNRQVAQALNITPKTATRHLEHIYTKLGAPP